MEIKPSTEGSVTTLALEGWLDTTSATELADAIDNIDDTCTELILDFAALEYISSSGLRQVVSAWKKMGGNLRVINVKPDVLQVFHMAGFDQRLNIS